MIEKLSSRFDRPWCEDRPLAPIDPPAELIDAAELARRLGIARSTVYANARRYGAIRLGDGPRAPLRFDYAAVLASLPRVGQQPVEMLVPLFAGPSDRGGREPTQSQAWSGAARPARRSPSPGRVPPRN
jgi:hypothetical protein